MDEYQKMRLRDWIVAAIVILFAIIVFVSPEVFG